MLLKEQYITDEKGNQIGILLDIEKYRKLQEDSEELDAIRVYDLAISDDEIPFEVAITTIENSRQ